MFIGVVVLVDAARAGCGRTLAWLPKNTGSSSSSGVSMVSASLKSLAEWSFETEQFDDTTVVVVAVAP
jgi:hypothetical protein